MAIRPHFNAHPRCVFIHRFFLLIISRIKINLNFISILYFLGFTFITIRGIISNQLDFTMVAPWGLSAFFLTIRFRNIQKLNLILLYLATCLSFYIAIENLDTNSIKEYKILYTEFKNLGLMPTTNVLAYVIGTTVLTKMEVNIIDHKPKSHNIFYIIIGLFLIFICLARSSLLAFFLSSLYFFLNTTNKYKSIYITTYKNSEIFNNFFFFHTFIKFLKF